MPPSCSPTGLARARLIRSGSSTRRGSRMDKPVSFAGGCSTRVSSGSGGRVAEAARKLVSRNGASSVVAIVDFVKGWPHSTTKSCAASSRSIRSALARRRARMALLRPHEIAPRTTAQDARRRLVAVGQRIREGFRRYDGREVNLPRKSYASSVGASTGCASTAIASRRLPCHSTTAPCLSTPRRPWSNLPRARPGARSRDRDRSR